LSKKQFQKGRGAQINPSNPYDKHIRNHNIEAISDEDLNIRTEEIKTYPKTIVNKVPSPDVPMMYSINPYQGCEHGCVYCYARNTHPYWGYSAGMDFESKILIKENAVDLLKKKLNSKNWVAHPIALSGNTDCYQPIEKKKKITRQLLEVFLRYKHPVAIITKNALVLRDLDLLQELQRHNLCRVIISINTVDDSLRRLLEPRTSSIPKRLHAIKTLAENNIPIMAMGAPIIPGLNDHTILELCKATAEAGAQDIRHIIVRLNGDVAEIFEDWLHKTYPDRADKIISQIKSMHRGKLNDSEFRHRMRGSGKYAEIIKQQFELGRKKYFPERKELQLNTELFGRLRDPQMSLF